MSRKTFSPEVRERAVRLLIQSQPQYPSLWAAIEAIAPKIGCTPATLRNWHKHHLHLQQPDVAQQLSLEARNKLLERENRELQRANEILRKAAAFFAAAELDRKPK